MASPAQIDELKTKLTAYANLPEFGGDPAKVFSKYAGADDLMDADGLYRLLTDADIAPRWQRHFWVSSIIAALDANRDGKLSRDEIKAAANAEPHTFGSSLSLYGYLTIAGAVVVQIVGDEAGAKKLYVKGTTRLLRFSSGILSRSLEEFDGTGWQSCPVETL